MENYKERKLTDDVYFLTGYVDALLKAFDQVRIYLPDDFDLDAEDRKALINVENIRRIMAEWEKEE